MRSTDSFPLRQARWSPLLFLVSLVTLWALTPLGQEFDLWAHRHLLTSDKPGYGFIQGVIDRLASQQVIGLAMGVLAAYLAYKCKKLAPFVFYLLLQACFGLTGALKVLLAKNSTAVGDPSHWDGGYLEHGLYGIAYPSGHATEAVLFFGGVLFMLSQWGYPRVRSFACGWCGHLLWTYFILQTVVTSWLLGTHWVSDLVGGVFWGALLLRALLGWWDSPRGPAWLKAFTVR